MLFLPAFPATSSWMHLPYTVHVKIKPTSLLWTQVCHYDLCFSNCFSSLQTGGYISKLQGTEMMYIKCWSGITLSTSSPLETLMQLPSPLPLWDPCTCTLVLSCLQHKMYFSACNKTLGLTKTTKLGQQMVKRCLKVWSSSVSSKEKHTVAKSSFPNWKGNSHSALQLNYSHTS